MCACRGWGTSSFLFSICSLGVLSLLKIVFFNKRIRSELQLKRHKTASMVSLKVSFPKRWDACIIFKNILH